MIRRKLHRRSHVTLVAGLALALASGCSNSESENASGRPDNLELIGRYAAHYNAELGSVTYEFIPTTKDGTPLPDEAIRQLDYNDSTGVTACVIEDTNYPPGNPFRCLGLVSPYSCTPDYNESTQTLTFLSNLINFTSSTYYGDTRYVFANGAADHDVTYYAPFYFKLTGLSWPSYPEHLIQAVNTNFAGADCGSSGLTLEGDDIDDNGIFDCIWPDEPWAIDDEGDPGWDYTPFVTNGDMTPGEETGCSVLFQFSLASNSGFSLFFDMLGVRDDGTLPPTPVVTSHSDGDYVNTDPITIAGNGCNAGATVYAEGGEATGSGVCSGGGTFSFSLNLNENTTNLINVYQIDASKQSGSTSLSIVHDDVPPFVVGSVPANGEVSVDRNTNCHVNLQ